MVLANDNVLPPAIVPVPEVPFNVIVVLTAAIATLLKLVIRPYASVVITGT